MKKIIFYYVSILLVVSLLLGGAALASDVSSAKWHGEVRVTNNGTATTNVFVPFSLNTTAFIDNGYGASDLSDVVMQLASSDTIFMPGAGSNPWMMYVSSIGADSNLDHDLYSDGASGGTIRYFPGSTGMTVDDDATLELSDNGSIALTNIYLDTTVDGDVVDKPFAYDIITESASGNATARITSDTPTWRTPTSVADPDTDWSNDANAIDDNTATHADTTVNVNNGEWSGNLTFEYSEAISLHKVRYYFAATVAYPGVDIDIDYYANGAWHDGFEGDAETGNAWVEVTIDSDTTTDNISVRFYNGSGGAQTFQLHEIDMGEETFVAEVTHAVSSGEHDLEAAVTTDRYINLVDYRNLYHNSSSYVNMGDIYSDNGTVTYVMQFRLDSAHGVGSSRKFIWGKWKDDNNFFRLMLQNDGKLWLEGRDAGVYLVQITATDSGNNVITSWPADAWYTVAISTDPVAGARMRVDDGTIQTDVSIMDMPTTASNFVVGNWKATTSESFTGEVGYALVFTDNLTEDEFELLTLGEPPDDYVDMWMFDEGTGTTITDYGSGDFDGTASASSWELSSGYTDFYLDIDGTLYGANLHGETVPDNSNDWTFGDDDTTPYIGTMTVEVDGVTTGEWDGTDYHSTTSITDDSGNGNTGTATYRTTSSDSDVSADFISLIPTDISEADSYSLSTTYTVLSENITEPTGMFSGGDYSKLPAAPITEILTDSSVPEAAWWLPFLFLGICIFGFLVYGMTTMQRRRSQGGIILEEGGVDGSLIVLFVVLEGSLVVLGKMGPLEYYPAYLFPLAGLAIILSKKHFSWG